MANSLKYACTMSNALLIKFIFFLHGIISIYLLYANGALNKLHWLLVIPLICLVIEGLGTVWCQWNCKYFWPSGFIYILTILPLIWIVQMRLFDERLARRNANIATTNRVLLNIQQISPTTLTTTFPVVRAHINNTITQKMGLVQRDDAVMKINITYHPHLGRGWLSTEVIGKKVCQIGLIIGLLLGRWLMPSAALTRNQLSLLVLSYIGSGGDILGLFESITTPGIIYDNHVTIIVLVIYSLAVCQFSLVTTSRENDKDESDTYMKNNPDIKTGTSFGIHSCEQGDNVAPQVSISGENDNDQNVSPQKQLSPQMRLYGLKRTASKCCDLKLFQILVPLLMQDGPFLVVRLCLCIYFRVLTDLHMFFLCKNAFVVTLLIYRLMILYCCGCKAKLTARYWRKTVYRPNKPNKPNKPNTTIAGDIQIINVDNSLGEATGIVNEMTENNIGHDNLAEGNIGIDNEVEKENVMLDNLCDGSVGINNAVAKDNTGDAIL